MGQGARLDPFVLDASKAYAAIRHVVESRRARNARVFGSVLRGQDTDNSGLDILVDPTPETTLFDIGAIGHELGKLLGVPVDVLTPNAWPAERAGRIITTALRARPLDAALRCE